jgi:hypothetical protein
MLYIVISYSQNDLPFVSELVSHLKEAYGEDNILYEHEEDESSPQQQMQETRRKIAWCDVVVFVVSKHSLVSSECDAEVAEARRLGRDVIPVRIDEDVEVPFPFQYYRSVDMLAGINEDTLAALNARLKLVGARAAETQPLGSIAKRLSTGEYAAAKPAPDFVSVMIPPATPAPLPAARTQGRSWLWILPLLLLGIGALFAFNAFSTGSLLASPTATATPSHTPEATPVSTSTPVVQPSATFTATLTPSTTATTLPTQTPTATATSTATATATYTPTATETQTATATSTATSTPTATATATPVLPTATPTLTLCQRADVNGDGRVTRDDVNAILLLENVASAYRAEFDFDANGRIDRTDSLIVNNSLTNCG